MGRERCPSCKRRLVERGRIGNLECEVMPCHGPKGTDLVHLPADQQSCPECGAPIVVAAHTQDALFWLYGFGFGEQSVRFSCRSCGWYRSYDTVVRPSGARR